MRTGWNPRLAALLQRPDPAARLIPEAVVTSAEDVRRRKEEWDAADNTPGWIALDSGGARLLGISSTLFDQSDRTVGQYITDLAPDGSWPLARFEWQGLGPATTIDAVDVWLHPRVDGGQPQTVAKWQLRLFGLVSYRTFQGVDIFILELAELMPPVMVDAGGAEGVVTFQLGAGVQPARFTPQFVASPGGDPAGAAQRYDRPTMFAAITALDAQGAAATNVGWAKLQGTNVVNDGGHELTGWTLERIDSGPDAGRWRDNSVDASDVPYIVLRNSTYNPAKISFTGANRIDLGAPPGPDEQVEIVAQGETPGGSELLFELLADDGVTWVPVRDGQTTDELAGVSARQTYEMRVTLAPDAAGDVTPIVRDLGVRTVRRWTLLGPAEVQVTGWAFDPVTLRGEIPQATIEIIRDGERDYRDFATELLSDSPAADIEFRLWIGADRLPRSDWLLIDTYELEDYDPQPDRIVCSCISPLARLRVAQLPVYDEVGGKREPLVYTNQPIADIYADLVGGQVALPERYRGPGPTSVELVGKTITGSDAKTELDRLSLVAGGAIICSQGVVKWRDIAGAAGVTAIFPAEEIQVVGATPGLRQAVPEYFVPFDYSADEDRFRGEVRSFHLPALEAVRAGRLDAPARLDDETARWISSEQLARAIGERHVGWFGTGLILLDFTSEYAHPYLEPGDLVLVELRSFVARDPVTARALRGQLWALAVLSEVRDAYGRRLTAWVRSYADLLSTSVALARIGDVRPEVLSVERIVDADGNVDVVAYGSPATGYLRAAASKTAFPDAATVDASPALAGRVVAFDDLIQLGEGELAYVSIRAYERSDGQGAKSDLLKIVAERPGFAGAIECRARIVDSTETTVTVQVDVVAPAGAPTVQLIALTGANVVSGPAQGVPSPAGTQWTLSRPAFQTGVGQAQFRAALNGRTDDDLVAIEEQGRDTVPLLVRASVVANSEGTMTVRVAVADPFPGGDITVQYTQLGTGGVTPASPQVIPGAAVTADIDTTGSIDYIVNRPAAGSGTGRVTFTAARAGRTSDSDAVDVPELPPSLLPVAELVSEGDVGLATVRFRVTGTNADGSTNGLEYRLAWHFIDTPFPGWPLFQALPAGGATLDLARDPSRTYRIGAQVRDAAGRVSVDVWAPLPPSLPGISEGGNPKWSATEDDDGTRPEDGATRGAPTGTIVGATLAETVEDGAARARTGLDGAGAVALDVPLMRAVANVPAISSSTGNIAANADVDGDIYIPATAAPKVGTAAVPSSLTKRLRIPHVEIMPTATAFSAATYRTRWIAVDSTTPGALIGHGLLPQGVTITTVYIRLFRKNTSCAAECDVWEISDADPPTQTFRGTMTHNTTGWVELSLSLNFEITTQFYVFSISLHGDGTLDSSAVQYIDLEYTMPDYSKGY